MKGKWAAGIPPRNFTWIVKDQLAVSERPGGFAPNHRRVRRQEEIIWLRVQGFTRVVSLLPSPHNLAAYDEGELVWSHFPLAAAGDVRETLVELYRNLDTWLHGGERLLVHQEELGDRLMGVVGGYLLWSGRLPGGPQSIAVVERLVGHPDGAPGPGHGGPGVGARRPGRHLSRSRRERGGAWRGSGRTASRCGACGPRGSTACCPRSRPGRSPSRSTSTSTSTWPRRARATTSARRPTTPPPSTPPWP